MLGDRKDRDADDRNFHSRAAAAQRVQRGLYRTEDVLDAAQGSAICEAEDGVFCKGARPFGCLKFVESVCGGFSLAR